ncbi:TPA: hypothetical protein ACNEJR_003721 [Escherichia coli]|nr:hypothetical protein [Salmonella enterica subsp. enterica serovar Enteritidis]
MENTYKAKRVKNRRRLLPCGNHGGFDHVWYMTRYCADGLEYAYSVRVSIVPKVLNPETGRMERTRPDIARTVCNHLRWGREDLQHAVSAAGGLMPKQLSEQHD